MKTILLFVENLGWAIRCRYNLWLHGPYGLAKVVEKMPFRFLVKYLRRYGASIGDNCRFERGINLHRPFGGLPFENLHIGSNVYLGHNTLIDLTQKVTIGNDVIIASGCQIWTHASEYTGHGADKRYNEQKGDVSIGSAVIIYSGVVISHGVNIGAEARIGANSLVNKDIAEAVFAGGVPATEIRKL